MVLIPYLILHQHLLVAATSSFETDYRIFLDSGPAPRQRRLICECTSISGRKHRITKFTLEEEINDFDISALYLGNNCCYFIGSYNRSIHTYKILRTGKVLEIPYQGEAFPEIVAISKFGVLCQSSQLDENGKERELWSFWSSKSHSWVYLGGRAPFVH